MVPFVENKKAFHFGQHADALLARSCQNLLTGNSRQISGQLEHMDALRVREHDSDALVVASSWQGQHSSTNRQLQSRRFGDELFVAPSTVLDREETSIVVVRSRIARPVPSVQPACERGDREVECPARGLNPKTSITIAQSDIDRNNDSRVAAR